MRSRQERKKSLNLEKDLALTKEDLEAMRLLPYHDPKDLGSYLDFLDELWGSQQQNEVKKKFYPEQIRL